MYTLQYIQTVVNVAADGDGLDEALSRSKTAQEKYSTYSQGQVDDICEHVVEYIVANKDLLSQLELEETGIGRYDHKVSKILFSSRMSWEYFKGMKTCGVISDEYDHKKVVLACPMGIIAAYAPITNPVPTAIFKAICCLKSRNGMVLSPHVMSQECSLQALALVAVSATEAGAPEGLFSMVYRPTEKLTRPVMCHKYVDLVWATGGKGVVRHAYSSGKPAIGVGSANVPVILHPTCDIGEAIEAIIASKSYDNGVLCASEEVVVVPMSIYEDVREAISSHPALSLLSSDESSKVRRVLQKGEGLNPVVIGQDSTKIAAIAGIDWASDRISNGIILVSEVSPDQFNKDNIWLKEKLSPCLALHRVADEYEAICAAEEIIKDDGEGHSVIIHCNYMSDEGKNFVCQCSERLRVSRVTINQPGVSGTPGGPTSPDNAPSVSLGCGSWGGNSTTDNVGPLHLINKKRVNCVDTNINVSNKVTSDVKVMVRCGVEMFIELLGRVKMVVNRGRLPSSNLRKCLTGTMRFLVHVASMPDYNSSVKTESNELMTMVTATSMNSLVSSGVEENEECPEAQFLEAIETYMKHDYGKRLAPELDLVDRVCKFTAIPRSQVMVELFERLINDMDINYVVSRQKKALECIGVTKRLDIRSWAEYMKEVFYGLDTEVTNYAVRRCLNLSQQKRFNAVIGML